MSSLPRLSIENLPLGSLTPNERNPRKHTDRQIKQIARSIKTFGCIVPILIDQSRHILAGHGRWLACRTLGYAEIPAIRIEHLTEAQAKAFMIADNRLSEFSVWDDLLLAEALKDLSELQLDFSIETTGFTIAEIDMRIDDLEIETNTRETEEDEPQFVVPPHPTSKMGDQWLLRHHRILCGSALDPGAYDKVMQGTQAAMVFTDPPYNVKIDGHATGLGKIHHREFAMASGEMTSAEFVSFLSRACAELVRHSQDGSIHFVCMDWRHTAELIAAAMGSYSELKNICVWVKDNAGMGSLYRSQHEFVLVFKNGNAKHRNNVQLGRHGRNRSNVWKYSGAQALGRSGEEDRLATLHPTVKPVRMIADAILDCSARGDIVLDPFLGSGSTLMAAERVGRICRAIEVDPLYVDIAVKRWQTYTGENATHAETGRYFNEMTTELTLG